MTTDTDSFDGSPLDAFVHSRVDERNLARGPEIPVEPRIIAMHAYVYQSATGGLGEFRDIGLLFQYQRYWEGRRDSVNYLTGRVLDYPPFQLASEVGIAVWYWDLAALQAQIYFYQQQDARAEVRIGIIHPRRWAIGGYEFTYMISPVSTQGGLGDAYTQQPARDPPLDAMQRCTRELMPDPTDEWNTINIGGQIGARNPSPEWEPDSPQLIGFFNDPDRAAFDMWRGWVYETYPNLLPYPHTSEFAAVHQWWMGRPPLNPGRWLWQLAIWLRGLMGLMNLQPPQLPDYYGWLRQAA